MKTLFEAFVKISVAFQINILTEKLMFYKKQVLKVNFEFKKDSNKRPQKHELLLKTFSIIPNNIVSQLEFKVVEEIVDPFILEVDLGSLGVTYNTIDLKGPNFNLDLRLNSSMPLEFKSYNDILKYNSTSSYQHLLSKLEDNTVDLNIKYDYIRAVSESSEEQTYHFENFTHFSSAVERLKNFRYKLKLIESYDSQVKEINQIIITLSKII